MCIWLGAQGFIYLYSVFLTHHILYFINKEMRHRKRKQFAQGHTALVVWPSLLLCQKPAMVEGSTHLLLCLQPMGRR